MLKKAVLVFFNSEIEKRGFRFPLVSERFETARKRRSIHGSRELPFPGNPPPSPTVPTPARRLRALRGAWFAALLALFPGTASAYYAALAPDGIGEDARFHRAVQATAGQEFDRAAVLLDQVRVLHPGGARAAAVGLLRGVAAYRRGRMEEAGTILETALGGMPDLGDVTFAYLYRVKAARGDVEGALGVLRAVLATYPGTSALDGAQTEAARTLFRLGRYDAAFVQASAALQARPDAPDVPALALLAAQSLEKGGHPEQARQIYGRFLHDFPVREESFVAKERFDALFYGKVERLSSPLWLEENLRWATRLVDARQWTRAAEAYSEVLRFLQRNGGPEDRRQETRYALAKALYRAKRWRECIENLDVLLRGNAPIDRRSMLYYKARSLARSGREDEAAPIFRTLATGAPGAALAERARYHMALMYIEAARYKEAADAFRAYLAVYPARAESRAARWRMAWCLYRLGRTGEAAAEFAALAAKAEGSERARAEYWTARLALTEGRKAEALARLREVTAADATGYYGLQAYLTLRALGEKPAPPVARLVRNDPGLPSLPPATLRKSPAFGPVMRTTALLALGLSEDAGRELATLAGRPEADARTRAELARLADHAGRPGLALRWGESARSYLARYRATPGYEAARWRMPRAYAAIVREAARENALPPDLLWALIQRESRFIADAVSPVGAIGLMQLMPATAAALAKEAGDKDFDPTRLGDPRTNVRLGARYLRGLLARYGGRTALAAAAYNAGEAAVDRWLAVRGSQAPDLFVEEIPYQETRRYVMEVQRNFALYGWLYADAR
jgi:soluble lytic murein transglycosylase